MDGASRLPHSKEALENLAVALGVNSAVIWFNPATKRIDLKQTNQREKELEESDEGLVESFS